MALKTKVFVCKYPPTCTDFELQKLFERFGEVTECSVIGNYTFIHMKTEEQARKAIRSLNNWQMGSFKISVQQSTSEKHSGGGGRGHGVKLRGHGKFPPMQGGRSGSKNGGIGSGGFMDHPGPHNRQPRDGDLYGHTRLSSMINGYYNDNNRPPLLPPFGDRRPLPPMSRELFYFRDRYDQYDNQRYHRNAPDPSFGLRSSLPMDRRMPVGYDRRDSYKDLYHRSFLPPKSYCHPSRYEIDALSNSLSGLLIRTEKADRPTSGQGPKLNFYQGKNKSSTFNVEKKYFGDFKCQKCKKTWASAHSWENCYQQCNRYFSEIYPWRQTKLEASGEKQSLKPHPTHLCQKCKQLRTPCWDRQ